MPSIDLGEYERYVDGLLAKLPERQAQVYRWRTGIGGERVTFKEIGARMGVSQTRAKQIFNIAERRVDGDIKVYEPPSFMSIVLGKIRNNRSR